MKFRKTTYIPGHFATLLFCLLLLSSCIREDIMECPREIRVYFTCPAEGDAIRPADVDRMHLYVFDDKGNYLREYRDDHIAGFNADYYFDCSDLLPGDYRFIAWGGKDENCYSTVPADFTKGAISFDEALLSLKHSPGIVRGTAYDIAPTPLHHIFHAELFTASVTYAPMQRFDMPLTQLSNTINIQTVGLPANTDAYTFNITDNNCTYTFDGWFAACDSRAASLLYAAPCTKDRESQPNGSLNVLRLSANRRTPQLEIYNETTGKALYPAGTQSGDLIDLILNAYPKNNFDTTHTYDIVFTFTDTGDGSARFAVTITVNGWLVRDQDNELTDPHPQERD